MSNGNGYGDPNAGPHGNEYGYGYGYGQGYGDGYGEGHHPEYGTGHGDEERRAYPQEGWGGESDADATAFVQLPSGPLPPAGAGADAWGPLAAPGTGQGGYTPPPLDPAQVAGQPGSAPLTSAATSDPSGTGQWARPFGQEGPGAGQFYGQDEGHGAASYAQQQQQYPPPHVQQQEQRFPSAPSAPSASSEPSADPGSAAMGQGAAAALAGSHEARTQRRPLGSGGGVPEGEAERIGPGTSSGPGQTGQQHMTAAQFADAHARRQVPFDGQGEGQQPQGPVPGAPQSAADGGEYAPAQDGNAVAAAHSTQDEVKNAQDAQDARGAGPDLSGTDGSGLNGAGSEDSGAATDNAAATDSGTEGNGRAGMGTVRSGLPWTPSSGPAPQPSPSADTPGSEHTATGHWAAAGQDGPAPGNGRADSPPAPEPSAAPDVPAAGAAPHLSPERPADEAPSGRTTEGTPPDATGPDATGPGETVTDDGVSEEAPVELAPELGGEHPHVSYVLHVNGFDRPVTDAWIGESLLYVLRERLGLAGAKDGCSQGECGACSVQVDGRLVASCLVPAATSAGSEIRTVEGLAADGAPSDVQRALTESGAVQCGFCVPGLAMTVHDLLEGNHAPSELETRKAICGNLCRCSGYRGVLDAVHKVVTERAEQAAREDAEAEAEAQAAGMDERMAAPPRIPHQAGPGAGGAYFPEGGGL